jgi:hypothetical protein
MNDIPRTHPYFLPYQRNDYDVCKPKDKMQKSALKMNGVGYPTEHSHIPDPALSSPIIDAMKREKEIQFSEVRRKLALTRRMVSVCLDDRNDPPAL